MKFTFRFTVIILFLVAIGLLSLPAKQNSAIRDKMTETLSPLWKIEEWFSKEEEKRKKAQEELANPQYLIAKVLFRSHNSFNSSLWINIGSDDHLDILAKNSPVLSGDSVVGIVEYVGKKVSLVRLITDSALTPAVRVARNLSDQKLISSVQYLRQSIEDNRLHIANDSEQKALVWLLEKIESELQIPREPIFLAKGIVQGYGESLWQAPRPFLKGTGFNYDFNDEKGPARDLRTGQSKDPARPKEACSLVQVGDLLVTSGMDGLFPEGLKVARVHSISPLSEGAYAYDLIAVPTADELMDLEYVNILPPQGFDESTLPQRIDRILEQLA